MTIKLEMPSELRSIIKHYPKVDWIEIARRAMWKYGKKLESIDKILSNSKLTKNDVLRIRKILLLPFFEFYLPEFALEEIEKHKSIICRRSGLTETKDLLKIL